MDKNACKGSSRLTKSTLLGTMGYSKFSQKAYLEPTFSDEKMDFVMKALAENGGNYSRTSVVLGVPASRIKRWIKSWSLPSPNNSESESPNATRRFYEKTQDSWSIKSFDASRREVCIDLETRAGINHLSYTIPSQKPAIY